MSTCTNGSADLAAGTCDDCGTDAPLGRHTERNDTMTHRRVRWLCPDCHPAAIRRGA